MNSLKRFATRTFESSIINTNTHLHKANKIIQTHNTMTKIFATGATGYIGGDALYVIANAHPDYEITCLVRNSDKGALVAKEYAKVKLVYGDLDSTELLEEEAKKADIVCRKLLCCCCASMDGLWVVGRRLWPSYIALLGSESHTQQ